MFGIRDVEFLREIVRRDGFRAAADSLGVSQSAVSNRIAALERRLGVTLFDRTRRRAVLTPQGRGFLAEADRVVALRDRVAARYGTAGLVAGTLRLGVAETIVHTRLPAILAALRAVVPAPRIELAVETSSVLAERLCADTVDVAVLMREFVPPQGIAHPAGRFPMGWYAAPRNEATTGTRPMDLRNLAARPIVTFAQGSLPHRHLERLFSQPGIDPPLVHGCASLAALQLLVENGTGQGTLPREIAAAAVQAGRMTELNVEPDLRLAPLSFAICWLHDPGAEVVAALEGVARSDRTPK